MSTLGVPLLPRGGRGSSCAERAFAVRGRGGDVIAEARALGAVFALASLLDAVLPGRGSPAGSPRVGCRSGNAAGDELYELDGRDASILVGLIAIASGAHAAAVFLGADARRAGEGGVGARVPGPRAWLGNCGRRAGARRPRGW